MSKVEDLLPELRVMRAILASEVVADGWERPLMVSRREQEILGALKAMRLDTIEECARVAEVRADWNFEKETCDRIAAAIRALKDGR